MEDTAGKTESLLGGAGPTSGGVLPPAIVPVPVERPADLFDQGQRRSRRRAWIAGLVVGDVLALSASALVGAMAAGTGVGSPLFGPQILMTMLLLWAYGSYDVLARIGRTGFTGTGRILRALPTAAMSSIGMTALGRGGALPTGTVCQVVIAALSGCVLVPLGRALCTCILRRMAVSRCRVALVGNGEVMERVARRLGRLSDVEVVGYVSNSTGSCLEGFPYLGALDEIHSITSLYGVDRLVVGTGEDPESLARATCNLPAGVAVSITSAASDLLSWKAQIDDVSGMGLVDLRLRRPNRLAGVVKRGIDVVVSATVLILLSPLMLLIAAFVAGTSSGPVFYRQIRIGRDRTPFSIVKFRTMTDRSEADRDALRRSFSLEAPLFKLIDDPRVTTVGRWLRRTSLDELPQLINVLKGDMSLVGPRPFVPDESARFKDWALRRFDVRPGITGLWQVSGRSDLGFDELQFLDYQYVATWSLVSDLKILWQTPGSVTRCCGAY